MTGPGRLPDLVVIGTMKSGTTTLWRRLAAHPGVTVPTVKEPNAFSTAWSGDLAWYRALYAPLAADRLTIDASVSYTSPDHAHLVADRLAAAMPTTPLVVVLRHPVERLRAHYLHEVQRGRERRPFDVAIDADGAAYARWSRYATCLRPFLEGPLAGNLLGLRTEDLDDDATWARLLTHVGLAPAAVPSLVANVGSDKAPMTTLGSALWQRGVLQRAGRLPRPLRRAGRALVLRPSARADALRRSASAAVPRALRDDLLGEAAAAGAALGLDVSGWA